MEPQQAPVTPPKCLKRHAVGQEHRRGVITSKGGRPYREIVRYGLSPYPPPSMAGNQGDPLWHASTRTVEDMSALLQRSRIRERDDFSAAENRCGWLAELPGYAPVWLRIPCFEKDSFFQSVEKALAVIFTTPSGWSWLIRMSTTEMRTTFWEGAADLTYRASFCMTSGGLDSGKHLERCDAGVAWSPLRGTDDPDFAAHPAFGPVAFLFHEMVHALHIAEGTGRKGPIRKYLQGLVVPNDIKHLFPDGLAAAWTTKCHRGDERSATGLPRRSGWDNLPDDPDYSHAVPTENSLRRDLHLPERKTYLAGGLYRYRQWDGQWVKTPPF